MLLPWCKWAMLCGCRDLWIHIDGSAERFQQAPLVYRRAAVHCIINQLFRSCHDFLRPAFDFQGVPTDTGRQGPAAFFFFLVLRADANPDWMGRRPVQFALAVCRSICAVVVRTG